MDTKKLKELRAFAEREKNFAFIQVATREVIELVDIALREISLRNAAFEQAQRDSKLLQFVLSDHGCGIVRSPILQDQLPRWLLDRKDIEDLMAENLTKEKL